VLGMLVGEVTDGRPAGVGLNRELGEFLDSRPGEDTLTQLARVDEDDA